MHHTGAFEMTGIYLVAGPEMAGVPGKDVMIKCLALPAFVGGRCSLFATASRNQGQL